MKKHTLALLTAVTLAVTGCAALQTFATNNSAVVMSIERMAATAVQAAAVKYGGPLAGQLASYGLDALASVLQGYLNKPVPASIVVATPGIGNVGAAMLAAIDFSKPVTQADVDLVYNAAKLARGK